MKISVLPVRFFVLLLTLQIVSVSASAQQIAITFDDAPTSDSPLFTHEKRAAKIREHLKKYGVTSAFFVITGSITEQNKNQLYAYTLDGHALANHSHSHYSPGRVPIETYLEDIHRADSVLKTWDHVKPWYRFPFLNEGASRQKRDSIRLALSKLHLSNGYVTIDNYDWFINGELRKALRENKKVDYEALKKLYLDHIYSSLLFYDAIAIKALGRSPRHVLLLHENDLAALFLGDLLELLQQNGWRFISPEVAYEDPIAQVVPDVLFNGQGRIGAIAFDKGIPARELVQESEDEVFLLDLIKAAAIFE